VPQVQVGHITAITDYFLLPGDPAERNLVQHSLPVTGGASGSPVVDASGRVIAVLSGMNIIMDGAGSRGPSAAGVNFAQRASLVRELLENRADAVALSRQSAWETGFATFDDPVEKIPQMYYNQWVADVGSAATPVAVLRRTGNIERLRDEQIWATTFARAISEPGHYFAIAVSRRRLDIDMAFAVNSEVFDRDVALDWYPVLSYDHEGGAPVDIIVFAETDEQPDYELVVWRLPFAR
jgi:hypothetical protein